MTEQQTKLNDLVLILDKMTADFMAMQMDKKIGGSAHQAMLKVIEAKLWCINALSSLVDEEQN